MSFAEKLSFLMHITQTSNKELAAALSVDPSMISLMRTGKRKLSKNPANSQKMASFFAGRCTAAFQRQALSEMLDQVSISPSMPRETLASCLETWLQGGQDIAGAILSGIRPLPAPDESASLPASSPIPALEASTQFFFGYEGRREVMSRILQELREAETTGTMLTAVDDNLEWLLSDYSLSKRVRAGLLEAAVRGFTFYQIIPPLNYINRYAESLQFWLPLYATGKTKVYYYPRLRGDLYRHSIIVIPGRCVQYVSSVGLPSANDITMFSTDPKLVRAFEQQFQEHLSLCRPALTVHRDPQESNSGYLAFLSCQGSIIQLVNSLSISSMPRELMEQYVRESTQPAWAKTFQICLDNQPKIARQLTQSPYIDICRLATAEEVRSGQLPVASSSMTCSGQPYYTPETYCRHLKNILRLMDQYETYHFLPLYENEYPDYDLFVNDDNLAFIVRTAEPLMTMEIRLQPMVTAFREHLLRRAEAAGYEDAHREKVRLELRSLIQELNG